MDRADRGAQFPVPWDLFGLLGIPVDHRDNRHHYHAHRFMCMCEVGVANDVRNGDGIDDDDGQLPGTMCACTAVSGNNVRLHWCGPSVLMTIIESVSI